MKKNKIPNTLDYTNSLTQGFNEQEKAFNSININSLIPFSYGKIELEYIVSGNGEGEIGKVRYYDEGVYQETKISFRSDELGKAQKTTLNFLGKNPSNLAGKALVIYDSSGAVKVWFNVDGSNTEPSMVNTYRSIEIPLLSSYTSEQIAQQTSSIIHADISFLAVYSLYYVIVSHNTAGVLTDSYDFNSSISIKNIAGVAPNRLNNKYFFLSSALDEDCYYVWYNVGGTGTDPSISLKTGVMVNIPSGASAQQVLQNTKVAIDGLNKFITNINNGNLLICNSLIGSSTPASEESSGFLIFTPVIGNSRQLVATLNLTYNSEDEIESVERL